MTIEDIILQEDQRGISGLRSYLPSNFVAEAAELIMENLGRVLISTGFYILSSQSAETDGPPGAAAMASAIKVLGGEPVFVTDSSGLKPVESIAGDCEVVEFPVTNHFESSSFAHELLQSTPTSALISIERAGLSKDGSYRNMNNRKINEWTAKIDHLFDQHPRSVGVGDGGNEIGMGNLYDTITTLDGIHPNPSVTTVSKLVISSCSNWGGYGIVAAMSLIARRNLLPRPEQVEEWVNNCVAAGAVDGFSGERRAWVDGKPVSADMGCVEALDNLLTIAGVVKR